MLPRLTSERCLAMRNACTAGEAVPQPVGADEASASVGASPLNWVLSGPKRGGARLSHTQANAKVGRPAEAGNPNRLEDDFRDVQ